MWNYGGKSSNGTIFSPCTLVSSCQYHFKSVPCPPLPTCCFYQKEQDRQCTYKVTLRCVHEFWFIISSIFLLFDLFPIYLCDKVRVDHTQTHPVEILWTSDQLVARAATYTTHETNIHAVIGIQTREPSEQVLQTYVLDRTVTGPAYHVSSEI